VSLSAINLLVFLTCFAFAEITFRLWWNPKYWIHTDQWLVGSGQTEAGKKWWPSTTYKVESSEFVLTFRTNDKGYRARPNLDARAHPYRVAFVGDSFTEGMQVPYESTFCALIEDKLNLDDPSHPLICENNGVSATDLLDYWHRIVHDVFAGPAPDALVLCIFPGNDFQAVLPDAAFDADDRPRRDYFTKPSWGLHFIAWVNLHSKFGCYLQRALFSIGLRPTLATSQAPKNWWNDPEVAASAFNSPALRRSRSIFRAIDDECRRNGTKLCVLVVGPVANYLAKDGQSPLARILAGWGLDIPVIDIAIKARARSDFASLVFPLDGHLNESGHAYLAERAAPAIAAVLGQSIRTARRP
jgi:hypothetical protein